MKIMMYWDRVPICGLITEKSINLNQITLATKELLHPEIFNSFVKDKNHIKIINDFNEIDINDLDVYICAGWSDKAQMRFAKELSNNNKICVLASDNSYKGNLRQFFGMIYFRIYLKRFFEVAFVPGKSGIKLMRFFGFRPKNIITNFYGAHNQIFKYLVPINKRKKEFLFVGQLIDRKGIKELISAYDIYLSNGGDWALRIVGDGPLNKIVSKNPNVIYEGPKKPLQVAEYMNNSICLVVPSRLDHWATVVCEAASSGMLLLTSKKVGASEDLVSNNGYIMSNIKPKTIAHYLSVISEIPEVSLYGMSEISRNNALNFNQDKFLESIIKITQIIN